MAKNALPTSVRLDADLKEALARAAADDGRSVSSLMERILRAWLMERSYLPRAAAKARKKPEGRR
jgi:hypothetical protein